MNFSQSKKAFTMIELVFVIVVLGILAAVALPKLVATRDDAYISKLANNIMIGVGEISSYAMSNAQVSSDLSLMSNAIKKLLVDGDVVLSDNKAVIQIDGNSPCLEISIDSNLTSGTDILKINLDSTNSDSKCLALQGLINSNEYPMKLRGTSVIY